MFIRQLLEKIQGAKSVSVQEEEYEMIEGVPAYVFEAIKNYANSVKKDDCISSEEFFEKARKKVSGLYSRK